MIADAVPPQAYGAAANVSDVAAIKTDILQIAIAQAMQCKARGLTLAMGKHRDDPVVEKRLRPAQEST
jgi:hypothetical protein